MQRIILSVLFLALVAPVATADEHMEYIVASPMDPGTPEGEEAWVISRAELEADYPAVARAVDNPNNVTKVEDDEEESVEAFFAAQAERDTTAIDVEGELFQVGITLGQGNLPPGDMADDTGAVEEEEDRDSEGDKGSPGLALLGLLGALGVALLVSRK